MVSPDLGGGFGNKVPVYPGYVVATAASLLLGHPVKWIEEPSENLISTGFARDYHMHGEMALKNDGTMLGLRTSLLADEGAFFADAQPSKFKVGSVPYRDRLLRPARPRTSSPTARTRTRRRRCGVPLLVPRHRGVLPDRAAGPERRVRARAWIRPSSGGRTSSRRTLPVRVRDRVRLRLRRLPRRDEPRAREDRLRRTSSGNRRRPA